MDNQEGLFKLSSNFGVTDTQTLSSKEIDNFLDGNPEDVLPVDEEKPKASKSKATKPQPPKEEDDSEDEEIEDNTPAAPEDIFGEEDEEEKEKPIAKGKKEEKPSEEDTESELTEPDNVFSNLTKELQTLGVFDTLENEEEITTGNKFKERFEIEIKNKAEGYITNFLSQFGEDYQEAFQAIYVNGVDPKDYFHQSNNIASLEEFDLSIVDNQKQIIKDYYKSIGWQPDKIASKIQKLEDAGDLEDDATGFHQVMLQKQREQLQELNAKKAQEQFHKQQQEQQYQTAVVKILNEKITKKEFDGIPVDKNFAVEVNDYLTTNKYRLPNGELLTQFDLDILNLKKPENYELKVKLAMLTKLVQVDPTLSKIAKKAISQEKDEAFRNFTRQKQTTKKRGEETYSPWNLSK